MKRKIVGILICMFLIPATVLPVAGTMYEIKNKTTHSLQLYGVEWTKTYGGPEFDMLHCIHQTQDGGYLASGATEVSNRYYPMLLKLDSVGDEVWNWTITQISYEQILYDILDVYPIFCNQVNDGGYLFCLWLDIDYNGGVPCIAGLFKFNESGEQEWVEFYSNGFDWIFRPISFIEVDDSYVVTGTSGDPYSYMGEEAGLLKTNEMGIEQWYKEFKYGDYDDRTEGVCRTNDGGYILTGWGRDTSYDYWMIKTDEFGNEQWNKTYGSSGDDYCHTKDCYQTSDGGFIMGGFSSSFGAGGFDVWLVKTDSTGNMVWNKTYGGTNNDMCWGMESTDDGGYVVVATMNYDGFSGDKDDINLVNIDGNGNIVWVQEYATADREIGTSVDKTSDGGFIVAGCNDRFHAADSDGLIVKFEAFDNQRPDKPDPPSGPDSGKPGTEYTYSSSTSDSDGDQVFYLWDWGDGNFSEWFGPYDPDDTCEASYAWEVKGDYEVKVMAKDVNSGESEWSEPLSVSMPRNKISANTLFLRLLESFSNAFPLLRYLLVIYD